MHPAWCWNVLVRRPITLANFKGSRADPGVPLLSFINQQFDPAIGWKDLEWVASHWGGPLAIKGILCAEDALKARDHGAGTIILSNHGGRQLDAAVAPMEMLQIGRASCRERVCQYGVDLGGRRIHKKKK